MSVLFVHGEQAMMVLLLLLGCWMRWVGHQALLPVVERRTEAYQNPGGLRRPASPAAQQAVRAASHPPDAAAAPACCWQACWLLSPLLVPLLLGLAAAAAVGCLLSSCVAAPLVSPKEWKERRA